MGEAPVAGDIFDADLLNMKRNVQCVQNVVHHSSCVYEPLHQHTHLSPAAILCLAWSMELGCCKHQSLGWTNRKQKDAHRIDSSSHNAS